MSDKGEENKMSQWHVFYRTAGMSENNQDGWRRTDFLAASASEALDKLLTGKQNVLHARVYPGESAYSVIVEWSTPTVKIRHEPHEAGL